MGKLPLQAFIGKNREELIRRCRVKVAGRGGWDPSDPQTDHGVPLFLDQLVNELGNRSPGSSEISKGALTHGRELFLRGLSVSQVVHSYGDVCQSITDLAVSTDEPIDSVDFRTLNRCLDDAIAGAVTEHAHQQTLLTDDHRRTKSMELKNLLFTAITAYEALQTGSVGVSGTTGSLVHRSLLAMRDFV
jgi:hypothetical protein